MHQEIELIEVPGKWEIPYSYTAGETISKFFVELRDNARIMATKCPQCQRILLPPRSFCERCFISLKDQWVELEPVGELRAFTIVAEHFEGAPEPPYVICFVTLGGSTTTMAQFLEGIDLSDLERAKEEIKVGMPVRAVFKERAQRQGRVQDFYIELIR